MLKHDRSEWTRCGDGPRYIQGRNYAHLIEFRRPCKTCGEPFSIFVTPRIADEEADSNSFGLKNCELHRRGRASSKPDLHAIERELRAEITKLITENERLKNKLQKYPWET
jgi:hypothetical protein